MFEFTLAKKCGGGLGSLAFGGPCQYAISVDLWYGLKLERARVEAEDDGGGCDMTELGSGGGTKRSRIRGGGARGGGIVLACCA